MSADIDTSHALTFVEYSQPAARAIIVPPLRRFVESLPTALKPALTAGSPATVYTNSALNSAVAIRSLVRAHMTVLSTWTPRAGQLHAARAVLAALDDALFDAMKKANPDDAAGSVVKPLTDYVDAFQHVLDLTGSELEKHFDDEN